MLVAYVDNPIENHYFVHVVDELIPTVLENVAPIATYSVQILSINIYTYVAFYILVI